MPITLKDLISKLNNGWYLPSFQRDYVWLNNKKSRKIEKLFDSLYNGQAFLDRKILLKSVFCHSMSIYVRHHAVAPVFQNVEFSL